MKDYALRVEEKNYALATKLAKENNISFNQYVNDLIERDLTDHLWTDVESRINSKINLLSEVMEEQTREYINNKKLLRATIDVLLESLNVEVVEED